MSHQAPTSTHKTELSLKQVLDTHSKGADGWRILSVYPHLVLLSPLCVLPGSNLAAGINTQSRIERFADAAGSGVAYAIPDRWLTGDPDDD
jgi:hypothetical protein